MKAQKTKDGKLKIQIKKSNPVINDWKDPDNEDKKAKRKFGLALRNSSGDKAPLVKVSDRKYVRSGVADWDE